MHSQIKVFTQISAAELSSRLHTCVHPNRKHFVLVWMCVCVDVCVCVCVCVCARARTLSSSSCLLRSSISFSLTSRSLEAFPASDSSSSITTSRAFRYLIVASDPICGVARAELSSTFSVLRTLAASGVSADASSLCRIESSS